MKDKMIKLKNGDTVSRDNYIKFKTRDLIDFGYTKLTENEVSEQLDKILNRDKNLSVIGMFCKSDIDIN